MLSVGADQQAGEMNMTAEKPGSQMAGYQPTAQERAAAAAMLRMICGIHVSRAIYVAAELGIADLLAAGPVSSARLAEATGVHEPSLYRVLRLLASLGVLAEGEHRSFGLTVLGDRLRADVPASMRSWAMLADAAGGVRAFEPIVATVRTGAPGVDLAHGMGLFEYLACHPEHAASFDAAMSERTAAFAPGVAAGHDFSGVRTVVDVGGGTGTLLAAILRAHGRLRGVLMETPAVAAAAGPALEAAGVADRCEVVAGDFFARVPEGADRYLLANVLHDWDDDRAVAILAQCRRAMADGGRVLIIERLVPDDPGQAVPTLLSDLNMLIVTGGKERTSAEYGELLARAGLALHRASAVAFPYGIIEGVRS
jgi:SAM-dependent methyltransferase